jgi:hypothetical protein
MKEWRIICAFHYVLLESQNPGKQHGAGEADLCEGRGREKKSVKDYE